MSLKQSEKSSLSTTAFESLERDFQEVLSELAHDHHLEKFRIEYEKLHRTLLKSHENEKRLMKRCAELNAEIVANAGKVHTALKLSQDDQNTIHQLKKELEKSWKMVEASHEKERKAKETIEALTKEIGVLSKLVDHGHGVSADQEDAMNELVKQKEKLEKDRDIQQKHIQQLLDEASKYQDEIKKVSDTSNKIRTEMAKLKDDSLRYRLEYENEERARFKAEKTLMETRNQLDKKNSLIVEKDAIIADFEKRVNEMDNQITQQVADSAIASKQQEELQQKISELEKRLSKQISESVDQERISNDLRNEMKEIEMTKHSLKVELEQEQKEKQQIHMHNEKLKGRIEMEKEKRKLLNQRIEELKQELLDQKKQWDSDVQKIDHVKHERNILERKATVINKEMERTKEKIRHTDDQKKGLESSINSYRRELEVKRNELFKLEKDNLKMTRNVGDVTQKYHQLEEELKSKIMENDDLNNKIVDFQEKLKQQQALYEAVRSDRNMYSKNLIDANEKIAEFKRKFSILGQQISQLNEEVTVSDKALCKAHIEKKQLEEEKRKLNSHLQKSKRSNAIVKEENAKYATEIKKLNQIIQEADVEREQQKKELERIVNYRDILGTQLIRRNDEIALLYEKIKIQQSALSKGAVQYQGRLDDIRILRLKIQELQRKISVMRKDIKNAMELKRQLADSQRKLLTEKTRVKALSEELENPMNIHRWRKLEGSDPTAYEMILKIQTLQKRLIKKNEEVMERDLVIQEKQKLYEELKKILHHQPGPEAAEQLNVYQDTLRKKNAQMKTMASELNMYMFKVKETKYEAERLARELSESKKKYFDLKKKERASTSHGSRGNTPSGRFKMARPSTVPGAPKSFVGGGFSLRGA